MFASYAAWSALLLSVAAIDRPYHTPSDTILPLEKRQVPAGLPKATWGHTYYLHSKASEYTYMSVIYTPGKTPPNPKGSLFLWPGLLDKKNWNKGNLIQTVTELHGTTTNRMVCGATAGQWQVSLHNCVNSSLTSLKGAFDHSLSIIPPSQCPSTRRRVK
jgi:hypothetical protein